MQLNRSTHTFKSNSSFENVLQLYNFDRELRLIIFDAVERIEIALRSKLVYSLSHELDPWWIETPKFFKNEKQHQLTLESLKKEVNRSKDAFIIEHRKMHMDDHRLPPAWKTLELSSFGTLSKLYGNLKNTIKSKDQIAEHFGAINHTYLPSWLQSIAQIRNICAHHGRLWNKNLPGKPKLLKNAPFPWLEDVPNPSDFQYLYIHLSLIKYMLDRINPDNHFSNKLKTLLHKYPNVDEQALGLTLNWKNEPLWKE